MQQSLRTYDHSHTVDLADVVAFINTHELENGALVDHLDTPERALGWIVDHGLVHGEEAAEIVERFPREPKLGGRILARVQRVRAGLREVADAVYERRAPDPKAVEAVNRALRRREVVVLQASADGVAVGHRHEGDPVDDALARLAEPIVREIADGRPERLRICANDTCRWVFYDESPTGRRRWCDMASCGNRAKAARHRARKREATAPPNGTPAA
jgi:predicted RNA-binding Zn ribbon-like protein